MALYYLETSALVKLYVREPGTDPLLAIAGQSQNLLCVLALAQVELRSAIRRRERDRQLSLKTAGLVLNLFEEHLRRSYIQQVVNDQVMSVAAGLIDRYTLRAFDSLQLAGCMVVRALSKTNPPIFTCADQKLLQAARSEKLSVLDPCTRP